MVHAKAAKACLVAVAAAFIAMAIALVPMFQISTPTLSPELVAKLATVGGTGNPTAKKIETLVGGSFNDGRTIDPIHTPQEFAPFTGSLTLDESAMLGRDNVVAWAVDEVDQDVALMGISQGAVVLSLAIARWNNDLDSAPSPDQVDLIVLLANPMRPNGGALSRFPGLSIFGINFYGPTEQSQYQVVDSAYAYDLFANAPLYLNNPLSLFNAFAGIAFPYDGGNSLHGTDPDWTDPDLDVRTEVYGNTTYHTIIPKNLPMLEPLRAVGLGAFADVIQPLLKVWVDAGYYKNDPAASPGVFMPAQLFMPLENIIRALVQTPGAIMQGLATIPRRLGLVPNSPQLSQTEEEPPVVDDNNESDSNAFNRSMSVSSNMTLDSSDSNEEGGEVVTDLPKPEEPVTTGNQGGEVSGPPEQPSEQSESPVAGGGDDGQEVPNQEPPATPNTQLGNEGSEDAGSPAPPKDEVNEDNNDNQSSVSSINSNKDDEEKSFKKGAKKDGKKSGKKFGRFDGKDDKDDEDSTESTLTRPAKSEAPSAPKNDDAGDDRDPSGPSSADNKDNDTANAA